VIASDVIDLLPRARGTATGTGRSRGEP
jgi:hypothetical protein